MAGDGLTLIVWLFIILSSVVLGIAFVQFLAAPPRQMSFYIVVCVLQVIGLAVVIWQFIPGFGRLAAAGTVLIGFGVGYLVRTHNLLGQDEQRIVPELNLPASEHRSHTTVIYFTHGEPPAYSPMPWIETFKELDSDRVSFIPWPFRPFFFFLLRDHYLRQGGSPHNYIHQDMVNSLKEAFRQTGDNSTRFYLAFLDSDPRPDEAVINALNDGANRIVMATVFVTVSSHTQAGQKMIEELNLDGYGVPILFTEPLWDSDTLQQMFVARANEHLNGVSKSKVGVLLVGHGQPEDWDRIYPTQTGQEILFRKSIIQKLTADRFLEENIAMAWMEFKQPGIAEEARRLASRGVEKIFVFATSISASSLHSLYDIPEAVHQAGLPKSIQVVNLGAWDNDPVVIKAIKERVDDCLEKHLARL